MPTQPTATRNRLFIVLGLGLILASLLLSACEAVRVNDAESFIASSSSVVRFIIGLAGVLFLVAGFALYEFLIQITGFILGGIVGSYIAASGLHSEGLGVIVGFIVGGVLGAGLAMLLSVLGIFAAGFFVGATFISGAWSGLLHQAPPQAVPIIAGIIGGVILLALYRLWIVLLTAIIGAALFGLSIGAGVGWWILFCLLGIGIQYGVGSATGNRDKVMPGYQRPGTGISAPTPSD